MGLSLKLPLISHTIYEIDDDHKKGQQGKDEVAIQKGKHIHSIVLRRRTGIPGAYCFIF
ncbi:hypothetical protein [Eudoraea algarum]|uniref:hypothetical protein n=1 Tax=Eudoraea algarum TaxID=3417568 RepID=UPI003F5D4EC3